MSTMFLLMPQIFQNLSSIKCSLKLRMEAYQNALKNETKADEEFALLKQCQEDAQTSYAILCAELYRMEEEGISAYSPYNKPLTSEIYYGVAKSTENKMTINLSLRLGDMFLIAAIEDILKRFNLDELVTIKEFTTQILKCLHRNIGELYLEAV